MTANQIAFYKAKQEAKHYRRQDKETKRHNVVSEMLNSQDLSLRDWANRENIRLGFTNADINKAHLERQDAINAAHYERSDTNAEKLGHIQNDQLILQAISTLGTPDSAWTLNEKGERVHQGNAGLIGFDDYYNNTSTPYVFSTTPLSLDYLSPSSLAGYGRTISGIANAVSTVGKLFGFGN